MIVKIQRADEVADFAICLCDIDDIFFQSSAKRDFCSQEEKQTFREMSLGRYIEKHRSSFFVALDADGRAVGYLAGCLENPITLDHFNDVAYFRAVSLDAATAGARIREPAADLDALRRAVAKGLGRRNGILEQGRHSP